jgi:hypothetical protein
MNTCHPEFPDYPLDDQEAFDKKLAAEQAAGFKDRMENSPPIGAGPDGKVVTYGSLAEVPPWVLEVVKK